MLASTASTTTILRYFFTVVLLGQTLCSATTCPGSRSDAVALSEGCTVVTGSLRIYGSGTVSFPVLTSVGNDVYIQGNGALSSVSFPVLTSVGHNVCIRSPYCDIPRDLFARNAKSGQCGSCGEGFYTLQNEQSNLGFDCIPCPSSMVPTLLAGGSAVVLLGGIVFVAVKLKKRALLFVLLVASQFFQLSFITLQIAVPWPNFLLFILNYVKNLLSFNIFHAECAIEYGALERMILSVGFPTFLSLLCLMAGAFNECLGMRTARFHKKQGEMLMVPKRLNRINRARRLKNAAFTITNTAYGYQIAGCFRLLPCDPKTKRLYFEAAWECGRTLEGLEGIQIAALAIIAVVGLAVPLVPMCCLFRKRKRIRERDPHVLSVWGSLFRMNRFILFEPAELLFRLVVSGVAITLASPLGAGLICLGLAAIRLIFIWIWNPYKPLYVFCGSKPFLLSTWFPRICSLFHLFQQAAAVAIAAFPGWEFSLGVFYTLLLGLVVFAVLVAACLVFIRWVATCKNKKATIVHKQQKERRKKKKNHTETPEEVLARLIHKVDSELVLFETQVRNGRVPAASNQLLVVIKTSDLLRRFVACYLPKARGSSSIKNDVGSETLVAELTKVDNRQTQGVLAVLAPTDKKRLHKQLKQEVKGLTDHSRHQWGSDYQVAVVPRSRIDQLALRRIVRQALLAGFSSLAMKTSKHFTKTSTSVEQNTDMVVPVIECV